MNALETARARLKALLGELDVLSGKDGAEEVKKVSSILDEIEELEKKILTLQREEQVRARVTVDPHLVPAAGDTAQRTAAVAAQSREAKAEEVMGLCVGAVIRASSSGKSALIELADAGYTGLADTIGGEMKRRIMDTDRAEVLIPEVTSPNIIEFLRPRTTFFQGGPTRIQFTNGKFKAPRGASGATASYIGEAARKPVTDVTFDYIQMSAKKLAAITLITKEARMWSIVNIDAYIRNDLRKAMADAIDLHAYFGTGAGDSPTGILRQAGVPQLDAEDYFVDMANPTINEIDAAASAMILSLTQANLYQSDSWAWVMNYRTLEYLRNLRVGDDTGVYAYPETRLPAPTFRGIRILVSNQIPQNGGTLGDETSFSLIDFSEVLYGEEGGIIVKTSDQASVVDGNGTTYHLWQQNMYGILTEHFHDFGIRYDNAAVTMRAVRWGAGVGTPGSP